MRTLPLQFAKRRVGKVLNGKVFVEREKSGGGLSENHEDSFHTDGTRHADWDE
jgi:hypothetical protein